MREVCKDVSETEKKNTTPVTERFQETGEFHEVVQKLQSETAFSEQLIILKN